MDVRMNIDGNEEEHVDVIGTRSNKNRRGKVRQHESSKQAVGHVRCHSCREICSLELSRTKLSPSQRIPPLISADAASRPILSLSLSLCLSLSSPVSFSLDGSDQTSPWACRAVTATVTILSAG